jgi:hypothetical protein
MHEGGVRVRRSDEVPMIKEISLYVIQEKWALLGHGDAENVHRIVWQ